jgi:hypothetical protein
MKKLTLIMAMMLSVSSLANEAQNRAMMDMMKAMAGQSADNPKAANCLGTTVPKMQKALNDTMDSCFAKLKNLPSEEFTDEISACMELELPAKLRISPERFQKCDEQNREDEPDFMTPEMSVLQDKIDRLTAELDQLYERGASESALEKKMMELESASEQLNALMMQAFAPGGSMQLEMQKQLDIMSKSSEGSLHLITLPIYPGSKVMMHMPVGGKIELDKQYTTLPAATFTSADKPETVAAFYQKNLKGFKNKTLDGGDIIFMRDLPADFGILTHMQLYVSQPHVMIKKAEGGIIAGAESFIEISYQPK